ncbi:hypothetical protein FE257_009135 [Aspergillus nanangensis]|uniref:Zn(2)-C6 fungal-type domain-containing protein n=1 Tax=Aspergillus nanangensis TaxID=2582783 RepID=A0AAD4GYM9_ASPNN|nr:hypothetical protein FE257_009135 [Aspergillus nanangensis]
MIMPIACEPCHRRKRRCDRGIPSCGLCVKTSRYCFYSADRPDGSQCQRNPASKELVTNLDSRWKSQFLRSSASYPVPFRGYMPRLIRCFCEGVGVSRLPVKRNSTAYQLQTIWMTSALNDPCLFHAMLFAGSSYLDLLRGARPSPITLLHQSEAIKHINERLSDPVLALDDTTFLAISPLTLFAELNGDRAAADIHTAGLQRLAILRGGLDKLGHEGLPSVLISVNTIVYSIAFDSDPGFGLLPYPNPPPLGLEARVLNAVANSYSSKGNMILWLLIEDLFYQVQNIKRRLLSETSAGSVAPSSHDPLHLPNSRIDEKAASVDPIYHCCCLGFQIFLTMLAGVRYPLDALVSSLKACLALTDDELWLRHLPAAYSWVCLTGAAAADHPRLRLWFYFKQGSAVRLLHVKDEPSFLVDLWSHFHWLRSLRRNQELALSSQSELVIL